MAQSLPSPLPGLPFQTHCPLCGMKIVVAGALYCPHCSYPVEAKTEKEHIDEVLRSLSRFKVDEEKALTVESLLYLSDLVARRSLYQVKSDDGKGLTLESVFYLSDLAVRDFKTFARMGGKSLPATEVIRFYEGRQQYIKDFPARQRVLEEQYKEAERQRQAQIQKAQEEAERQRKAYEEEEHRRLAQIQKAREEEERRRLAQLQKAHEEIERRRLAQIQKEREEEERRKLEEEERRLEREKQRAAQVALWRERTERWRSRGQTVAKFFIEPTILTISLGCVLLLAVALIFFFLKGGWYQEAAPFVILGTHLVFFGLTFVLRRLSKKLPKDESGKSLLNIYRNVENTYVFFALTFLILGMVKVLGLNAFNAIQWLIPALALYITCTAGLFALTQKFAFFGYVAAVSLATAFVTVALPLGIAPFYWPLLIMAMALCSLCSLPRVDGSARSNLIELLWERPRQILRNPMYTCMLVILPLVLLVSIVALPVLFSPSISLGLPPIPGLPKEVVLPPRPEALANFRVALVSTLSLVLLWGILFLHWGRRKRGWLVVALFALACALFWVKALDWGVPGYLFALTGVALLYHGASRFLLRGRTDFPHLGLYLDLLTLLLGGIVALISNVGAPLQLFGRSLQSMPLSLAPLANMLALGVSSLLVCSIALGRGSYTTAYVRSQDSSFPTRAWLWLLLPAGVLLTSDWSQLLLFLLLPPYQGMLALTVLLVAVAASVRGFSGDTRAPWSNPLDLLALGNAIFVCLLALYTSSSLKNNLNIASDLSLFFAILFYCLLLLQRRFRPLFIPFGFALFAAPGMPFFHPELVIGLGLFLPFAAMGVRRLMHLTARPAESSVFVEPVWEWPLFWLGIIYGLALAVAYTPPPIRAQLEGLVFTRSPLVLLPMPHLTLLPDKLALLALGLGWYVAAVLGRMGRTNWKTKWWLFLAALFAIWQLLIQASDEPYLLIVGLVAGLGGLGVWALTGRKARARADLMGTLLLSMKGSMRKDLREQLDWNWPWYVVMLVAVILLWGQFLFLPQANSDLAGYGLLAFAVLIYGIGLAEKQSAIYWGALIFSNTTFLSFTFHYQSPLYRSHLLLTIVATLLCIGVGVATNIFGRVRPDRQTQQRQWRRYILPFYATALLAGVCTGIYGLFDQALLVMVLKLLLIWAVVAYGAGLLEGRAVGSWLAAFFAAWALAGLMSQPVSGSPAMLLVGVAVVSIAVAVGMRAWGAYGRPGAGLRDTYGAVRYTLPIYLTALLAGVLSGSMVSLLNQQSGGLLALIYCCIAYAVAVFERRVWVPALALAFGIWALVAIQDSVTIIGIGLGAGIVSMALRKQLLTQLNIGKGPLR